MLGVLQVLQCLVLKMLRRIDAQLLETPCCTVNQPGRDKHLGQKLRNYVQRRLQLSVPALHAGEPAPPGTQQAKAIKSCRMKVQGQLRLLRQAFGLLARLGNDYWWVIHRGTSSLDLLNGAYSLSRSGHCASHFGGPSSPRGRGQR